jgi:hypothetical protein
MSACLLLLFFCIVVSETGRESQHFRIPTGLARPRFGLLATGVQAKSRCNTNILLFIFNYLTDFRLQTGAAIKCTTNAQLLPRLDSQICPCRGGNGEFEQTPRSNGADGATGE